MNPAARILLPNGRNPRDLFPGYHLPSEQQRREIFRHGLVSLDANALLDLYRFTPTARNEFLSVLDAIRPRLFITHQAAQEFYENRLKVFDDRLEAASKESREIRNRLTQVKERVTAFARRYQIAEDERDALIAEADKLSEKVDSVLKVANTSDIKRNDVRAGTDPVLERFCELFEGRVGEPLSDIEYAEALEEAARRRRDRRPPGYMDDGKEGVRRASGDYLLWRQLLNEAQRHQLPVLLVSNEEKEDWMMSHRGETVGPRPELVLEMRQEAGVMLQVVNVTGLLLHARVYLGAAVSTSTLVEVESRPGGQQVSVKVRKGIKHFLAGQPMEDQHEFRRIINHLAAKIEQGNDPEPSDGINLLYRVGEGLVYEFTWGTAARGTVTVVRHPAEPDTDPQIDLVINNLRIGRRWAP